MIDIDSVPVVLPDGTLWMDEDSDAITAVHIYREEVAPLTAPAQSYPGARRGPKPRQHHNKVQHWVDCFARQDMGEALTPSMNTCPQWLQDIIVGACRLNGSVKDNSKPIQAWMVFKVLTQCEYISTSILMEFFDYQYGERYIRQIYACCSSASASIERYFHRLADALAEATGREVVEGFSPDALWEVMGLRNRPLTDAEGWAVEKITQTLRIQQGLPPHEEPLQVIRVRGVQYHRNSYGWFCSGLGLEDEREKVMPVFRASALDGVPARYLDTSHDPYRNDGSLNEPTGWGTAQYQCAA